MLTLTGEHFYLAVWLAGSFAGTAPDPTADWKKSALLPCNRLPSDV
jgi:hypothetical protein